MAQLIDLIIREIISEDYELLAYFFDENNVPDVIRVFHPFSLDGKSAYDIACMDHLDRYYIALSDNKIIGFCMLRGWDEGYSIPSFGVLVDRKFQNLGLGRKITVHAIEEAKRFGCHRVRLSVYASNKIALNLYTSLGFNEEKLSLIHI